MREADERRATGAGAPRALSADTERDKNFRERERDEVSRILTFTARNERVCRIVCKLTATTASVRQTVKDSPRRLRTG